jgi:3-hydroxy-9,10-secoandrosta-1,3,5(10)-triene-9,17-dione monooxygenase
VSIPELANGRAPGHALHSSRVYRAPFPEVLILALSGAPLGIAQGALAAHAAGLKTQLVAMSEEQVAEQGGPFGRLAQASAEIDAAVSVVFSAARRIDASNDPLGFTRVERAGLLRDYAFAAQMSRRAVNSLFDGGGSRALYDSSELQRFWRDMNTACAHAGFSWDRVVPTFARALLDLPPGRFEVKRGH